MAAYGGHPPFKKAFRHPELVEGRHFPFSLLHLKKPSVILSLSKDVIFHSHFSILNSLSLSPKLNRATHNIQRLQLNHHRPASTWKHLHCRNTVLEV